jgi:RNA polymerase sigma-70 factor (ECF subfamily)
MHTDETLWQGLMKGEKEMFLALYRKYYHSLLFIGLKEIKDASLVKDAIQQQFLYLWEKRETIQEARNVKSYLVTSFLRKLTSDWKKLERTSNLQVAWSNSIEEPLLTPEESLIVKDGQFQLYKVLISHINALPARQKELIMLKFYEGYSYEEIVQKTGLAHRSVYNKIHEALKKLKLDMEKEHPGYGVALSAMLSALIFVAPVITDAQ